MIELIVLISMVFVMVGVSGFVVMVMRLVSVLFR